MKGQWVLIFGILAALIIAIFAVINVEPVRVNYLFGTNEWPLILVIIGSVLMGGIIVGSVGIVKVFRLQLEVKRLKKQLLQETTPAIKEEEQLAPVEKAKPEKLEPDMKIQQDEEQK